MTNSSNMTAFTQSVQAIRTWFQQHRKDLWIATLLALVCALAIEVGKVWFRGPDFYVIYLVGNFDNIQTKSVYDSFQTLADHDSLAFEGMPIKAIQINDEGTLSKAIEYAHDLSGRPETLMIIGSVRSQGTKAALPIYMSTAPRVPVITTTESDDDLLALCAGCDSDYLPILQLSPTNKTQAYSAVRYAEERGRKRCLIVDEINADNPDYSTNLTADLRDAVQSFAYKGVMLVGELQMGEPPTTSALESEDPDCVLYAGEPGPAHALLNSLRDFLKARERQPTQNNSTALSSADSITVVLSDASVNPGIASDSINRFATVYYTFASDAAYYHSDMNIFARDAFSIVGQLISASTPQGAGFSERARRLLGITRVEDARSDLIRTMERYALLDHVYLGSTGEHYQFGGIHRQDAFFHVWQVADGTVKDVDGWHTPILQSAKAGTTPARP